MGTWEFQMGEDVTLGYFIMNIIIYLFTSLFFSL